MLEQDPRKALHEILSSELTFFLGTEADQQKYDRAFKYGRKMHSVKGGVYTIRVVQVSSGPWVLIVAEYEGSEPVLGTDGSMQTADDGSIMQRSFWNYIGSKTFKPGDPQRGLSQADKQGAIDIAKRIGELADQVASMNDWGSCQDDGILPTEAVDAWS